MCMHLIFWLETLQFSLSSQKKNIIQLIWEWTNSPSNRSIFQYFHNIKKLHFLLHYDIMVPLQDLKIQIAKVTFIFLSSQHQMSPLVHFASAHWTNKFVPLWCHLPIKIILRTEEGTNFTFEKVRIAPSWSFILMLPMPSTFIFSSFPNLKWSNSPSVFKVSNISWSLQMCFEAVEFITYFVLATSSFIVKNTSSSSSTLFTTLAWELVPLWGIYFLYPCIRRFLQGLEIKKKNLNFKF